LIASLADPFIEAKVAPCFNDIDTLASFLGIDEGYLSVQVRLLLPQYSRTELEAGSSHEIIRGILRILRSELADFELYYKNHRSRNLIDKLEPALALQGRTTNLRLTGGSCDVPIRFANVGSEDGFEIQRQIHYIHQQRADTAYHLGLFLGEADFPACYCAISGCDREYQRDALSRFMGREIPFDQIAVMTRAYGYSPLPKNMMSKLFDLSARHIHGDANFKYAITALNPFLSFKGSIFLGSSYTAFATAPMWYSYTMDGRYANRRNPNGEGRQRYATPPIVWLVRSLDTKQEISQNLPPVQITSEGYTSG
jgi:hypothetical protein